MGSLVETPVDGNGQLVENAAQQLPGDVAQAFAARRAAHRELLAVEHETDSTAEMRREASDLRRRAAPMAREPGITVAEFDTDLRNSALRRSDAISAVLTDRIARRELIRHDFLPNWTDHFTLPQPVDHSFWWAQTQPHLAPGTRSDFRDDGLHFWGGPKVNDYDGEMHTSFGAVASFALQPERFPTSPSGTFLSSPHVDLFGGIVAYAPDWDLIQGNGIASCELFLRQTIFQWRFGPTGPVAVTIAEAKGNDAWRLYLKNTGYSRHQDMPGFKLIPAVTYNQNQIAPNELWAEVEVRLNIYLNCTGALVWCDPNVLVRTSQWAPIALP